ncbi:MAG TPA: hypothetical protein VGD64_12630 [Acidisarcina sp.]
MSTATINDKTQGMMAGFPAPCPCTRVFSEASMRTTLQDKVNAELLALIKA